MPAESNPPETLTATFVLKIRGRSLNFTVHVPTGLITLPELLPALFEFHQQLIDYAVTDEANEESKISCRAGCGACCRQLVPISPTEAAILQEWVKTREPEEAAMIREKFQSVVNGLKADGLLERLQNRASIPASGQMRGLGLDYFRAGRACPFLVEESCSVYPVRPMKCREYLVTSPAVNCRTPGPDNIKMVDFPVSFLKVLLHMEAWITGKPPLWIPLTLLFEEGVEKKDSPRRPGPELFERFIAQFAAAG